MNTNINQPNQRVFTIINRGETVVIADNKLNADGRPTAKAYKTAGEEIKNLLLEKLIALVDSIPTQRLTKRVAILLPDSIAFLTYEDTRTYWLINKVKKNGVAISEKQLALVAELDRVIKVRENNVYFFNQNRVTSPYYRAIIRGAWKYMDTKEAPAERLDSMDF